MQPCPVPEAGLLPHIRMARVYDTEKAGIRGKTALRTVSGYELSFFLTEGGSLFLDGQERLIHRWDLRFSRPEEQLCSLPPYRCCTVFFDFGRAGCVGNEMLERIPSIFPGREELEPLFRELVNAFVKREPGDLALANGLLLQLLAHCVRLQSQKEQYHPATCRCMAYIREHLSEDLSLERLGEQTGYSALHLLRIFRRDTGQTPHEYTQALRITQARQLLAESDQTILAIALASGYSSESYFQSFFKKLNHMTPGEYRRRARLF